MDELALLADMHCGNQRQGPGGDAETRLALQLAGLTGASDLEILDVGCGTGAASLLLAQELQSRVTAVDFLPLFLEQLRSRAQAAGLADRIDTLECSMDALPFADASYDLCWSEGAVYNMGFAAGISAWRRLLRSGGVLAVSEITWFTARRPQELEDFWQAAYPEIDTASAKLAILEDNGYAPLGWFALPQHCWTDNYYRPLQAGYEDFLARHAHSTEAQAIVAADREEVDLYQRYADYYGYGMYIARRVD